MPALILASRSSRRAQLLAEHGYRFRQIEPDFDEGAVDLSRMNVEQAVRQLAEGKATAVAGRVEQGIIIGCDTLVSHHGRRLGQPADRHEARRMIEALSGSRHEVWTGVCIIRKPTGEQLLFSESAQVTFEPLTQHEVNRYLDSGLWRGKAGGYNLAELQTQWRFTIEGDPTTVIGLPMRRLAEKLDIFTAWGVQLK